MNETNEKRNYQHWHKMTRVAVLGIILLAAAKHCYGHTIRKNRKTIITNNNDIFLGHTVTALAKTKKGKKTAELNCVVKHKKSPSPKGKAASPTISPAPTSSTSTPTKSGKGVKGEYCPTIISACSLLETEQAEFGTFQFVVDLKLAITSPIEEVLLKLQNYLGEELSQELAACVDFDVRRRLQENTIMKLDLDVTQDTTTPCVETTTTGTCVNVDVNMKVTHDDGNANAILTSISQAIQDRCDSIKGLEGIVDTFDPCPFSITGVGEGSTGGDSTTDEGDSSTEDKDGSGSDTEGGDGSVGSGSGGDATGGEDGDSSIGSGGDTTDSEGEEGSSGGSGTDGDGSSTEGEDSGIEEEDGGDGSGGIAAIVTTRDSEEGVQPGGYITISVAAALLLLMLLFVVRRRREYEAATRHKYLIDEIDEDETETYLKDSDADSQDQQDRQVHVVGEADSVFSGWSGFTGDRQRDNGGLLYPDKYGGSMDNSFLNQDVHKCASATCELCERKRRAGIQFVPSKMPSHSSTVPNDAPRHYMTGDTVTL